MGAACLCVGLQLWHGIWPQRSPRALYAGGVILGDV